MTSPTEELQRLLSDPNRTIFDVAWCVVPARTESGDMPQPWHTVAMFKYAVDAHEWINWKEYASDHLLAPIVFQMNALTQKDESIATQKGKEPSSIFEGKNIFNRAYAIIPVTRADGSNKQPWDAVAIFKEKRDAFKFLERKAQPFTFEVKEFQFSYLTRNRDKSHLKNILGE